MTVASTPTNNYVTPPSPLKQQRKCCSHKVLGVALAITGLVLVLVGLLFGTWLPSSVDSRIQDVATTCSVDDLSDSFYAPYDDDCDTCVPYYTSYSPFTITNGEAFLDGLAKPRVVESGPYVYRKFTTRVNVTLSDDSTALSYRSYDRWAFVPESSCASCDPDVDTVTGLDASYFATIARAGGERQLVTALLSNVLATRGYTREEIATILSTIPSVVLGNILKLLNGLNSLHFPTMASSLSRLGSLLTAADPVAFQRALQALAAVALEPVDRYAGVLTKRPVSDWALGFPSFLGGVAAAGGLRRCQAIPEELAAFNRTVNSWCALCQSDDPVSGSAVCKRLEKSCAGCAAVTDVLLNVSPTLCDELQTRLISTNNVPEATAAAFIASSCRRCSPDSGFLFCLVPVPGGVEPSGRDYNVVPVRLETLKATVQNTGCTSIATVSHYRVYDGITETPIWNTLDTTGRPTLKDMSDFGLTGLCDMPHTNCQVVRGGDGSSFPPAGARLSGLSDDRLSPEWDLYVSQAFQNLTIFYDTTVSRDGISLMRYRPSTALMAQTPMNIVKGTGLPVSGVQNLAYVRGFPVYVSEPFYVNGDAALYQNIDLITRDNIQITPETIAEEAAKYRTYLDIEPATGRTMNARKRLMGSFSVPKISPDQDEVMTNLNYPNLVANVIIPVFWAEERATVTPVLMSKFKSVKALANAFLPVLIVGILAGILFCLGGGILIQRHQKALVQKTRKSVDL